MPFRILPVFHFTLWFWVPLIGTSKLCESCGYTYYTHTQYNFLDDFVYRKISYFFLLTWFIHEFTQHHQLWKPLQMGKITSFIWTPKFHYFAHRAFTESNPEPIASSPYSHIQFPLRIFVNIILSFTLISSKLFLPFWFLDHFYARSQNYEKRILVSSCMSFCTSV